MTRSRSIDLDELLIDMEERNQGLDVPLSPPKRPEPAVGHLTHSPAPHDQCRYLHPELRREPSMCSRVKYR